MKKRHAFTLIEMLVVIAIIAIIAAMVVNGIGYANAAKRNALVNAQKQALMLMIANYQSKLNFYPPDNGNLATAAPVNYDNFAALNPLLYELTGATNNWSGNGNILTFFGPTVIVSGASPNGNFYETYLRSSVANGNPDEPHDFYQPGPRPQDYTNYTKAISSGLCGLTVPVPVSYTSTAPNFWHYDSSSTNRHNLQSYDLWAEYITSKNNIVTNGNW